MIFIAFLLQACASVLFDESQGQDVEEGEDLIKCSFESTLSRVSLSSYNSPLWNVNDQICVISIGGKNKQFSLVSGEGTATGTFRGTLPSGNLLYALYPYSNSNKGRFGCNPFFRSSSQ